MVKKNNICKNLTYDDCELTILRQAVDEAEKTKGRAKLNSPELKKIIEIVENFLKVKHQICYGGTAINNILPKYDQFYDKELEIPDYDFFSMTPLEDAKELADIYYKQGFSEVEAKAGQHYGTYKVFVNFIPVADITLLSPELFKNIKKEAITVAGILYAPPNYLRMAMYLELSRPDGDISRWEKVLKRITLLNKNYPLIGKNCKDIDFQRAMEDSNNEEILYDTVKNSLIDQGVIFFGGLAVTLYARYMPKNLKKKLHKMPDFDVLSEDAEMTAIIVKERLEQNNFKKIQIIYHKKIGEIISDHYEIRVGDETICFIYTPLACHNYNTIYINNKTINVASIDTMLSFYLAFLYSDREYYDKNRILCMSQYLFLVQQKNRLAQKGLLKRFSMSCYGQQETLETMRAEKTKKFMELKNKRNTREFEEWFLRYVPAEQKKQPKQERKTMRKTRKLTKEATQLIKQNEDKEESVEKTVKKVINETRRIKRQNKKKSRKKRKKFLGLF